MHGRIASELLNRDLFLGAPLYLGEAAAVLRLVKGPDLLELPRVIDGWRPPPSLDPNAWPPLFRQGDLDELLVRLSPAHLLPPPDAGTSATDLKRRVRPGDLLINKIAPLRAAVATPRLPRHLVDPNICLVRGLDEVDGAWLAVCLSQSAYSAYLLRHGVILPRLTVDTLAELRVPRPPAGFSEVAHALLDIADELLGLSLELRALVAEVEKAVVDEGAPATHADERWFWLSARRLASLSPRQSVVVDLQGQLAERGWPSIGALAQGWAEQPRFREGEPGLEGDTARVLRLSDGRDDLLVDTSGLGPADQLSARVYGEPLREGEVLLSTLVNLPRVLFVDCPTPVPVLPVDYWARLSFSRLPGAYALLLSTEIVQRQLLGMAIGTVQQFMPPRAVERVRLPPIDEARLSGWHRRLMSHHEKSHRLNTARARHLAEAHRLFAEVHPLSSRHHLQPHRGVRQ